MSPRSASLPVPRRDRGAEPSADGEWPRVSRPSCPLSRQPSGGGCPRRCVLNYLRVLASGLPAAGASPRALPGARARVAGRLTALGFVLLGRLGEPGRGRGRGRGRGT